MNKQISILLSICLLCILLSGCNNVEKEIPGKYGDVEVIENIEIIEDTYIDIENNQGIDKFDSHLINYIDASNKAEDNYCVSPLSIKLALSLLTEGANGETQNELLDALDVVSVDELRVRAGTVFDISKRIKENEELVSKYTNLEDNSEFSVSNSIWKNSDRNGTILESYKDIIAVEYNGSAREVKGSELVNSVNNWVSENTKGKINKIVDASAENMNTILVNTLYLKDSWLNSFNTVEEKEFTTIEGQKVMKEFTCTQNDFYYYDGMNCQMVAIPTQSDFYVLYVIGDNRNIKEKIAKLEYEEVLVEVPKMNIESEFNDQFLVNFLKSEGVLKAFDIDDSDFSNMIKDEPLYVGDIVHKTKLETDEEGIEGAAVTAILLKDNAIFIEEPKKPKEFIANVPFTFYVLTGIDTTEQIDIIFYGQNVK